MKPEHVIAFLFAEMGTTGSVDGAGRLVIKGKFQQKQIENVLRRYMGKYSFVVLLLEFIGCVQSNTSLARRANRRTHYSRRRIVSSSWPVNRVAVDDL